MRGFEADVVLSTSAIEQCHRPYRVCGSNENTNRLLRQYFPKGIGPLRLANWNA
jgi:IS30 family transposase